MTMRRALIVINPAARRLPRRESLAAARRWAVDAGWRTGLAVTGGPNEATAIARQAAEQGYDAVYACGGDGTLNEVANGLAGTNVALGFIPAGTVNIWAKEHRLGRDPTVALRQLTEGATRVVDLGWAEHAPLAARPEPVEGEAASRGRAFLLMAGIGYDAAVAAAVEARAKRVLGPLAFVRAMLAGSAGYRAPRATLRHDGLVEEANLGLLTASNSRIYAGILRPAPQALIDDGMLDIALLDLARVLPGAIAELPRLLLGRVPRDGREGGYLRGFRTADLAVDTDRPAPLQVDGEVIGQTPVRLTVRPRALRVIVAPGPNPLYGEPAGPALAELIAAAGPPKPKRRRPAKATPAAPTRARRRTPPTAPESPAETDRGRSP